MVKLLLFFITAMAMPTVEGAAPKSMATLFVTVSLSKSSVTIQKNTRRGTAVLVAPIIPIAANTIPTGTFKALRMTDRYRSANGNVILENVVRLEGEFNIRTSRMFERWLESGRPAARAIVLEAETGSLLFTTIRRYGLNNTLIRVIP